MGTMTRRRAAWLAVTVAALVGTAAGLRALATARSWQLFGTLVARGPAGLRRVALTFDDGPVPERLDTLLAVLGRHGVHATFFLTGRELAAAPMAGRELVEAGHEIGNHSYSHRRMVLMAPATVQSEIERTDSLLLDAGQTGTPYFRPPYGAKLLTLPWYLSRTHRTSVTWDLEPDSYREVAASAEGIVQYVVQRVRPGSIILLHPWYQSRHTSLAAIDPLLDSLAARGFQVVPVRELLAQDPAPTP